MEYNLLGDHTQDLDRHRGNHVGHDGGLTLRRQLAVVSGRAAFHDKPDAKGVTGFVFDRMAQGDFEPYLDHCTLSRFRS
jgi:hypothetical protein